MSPTVHRDVNNMPAITEGKVLVTGINGFIAGWIAKELLEQGFSVRGTVRSLDKAAPIAEALGSYSDRLEFVSVEDITKVRTTSVPRDSDID